MLWLIISTHGLLWNFANGLKISLLLMHLIVLIPLILGILFYVLVTAIFHEYVFFFNFFLLLYKRKKKVCYTITLKIRLES